MLSVTVPLRPGKNRYQDLRAEAPHRRHDVRQQRITRPKPERLYGGLGVTEIVCACEVLLCSVEATGRQ